MHQNRFRPRSRWGSLQRSPDPIAAFKGPTSKGKEGEGKRGGEVKGRGRGGEGENDLTHPVANSWLRH